MDPDIEQAWIEEVERRKESLKSGESTLHSAEEVINEARRRIQVIRESKFDRPCN
jgi:hypothetical protein